MSFFSLDSKKNFLLYQVIIRIKWNSLCKAYDTRRIMEALTNGHYYSSTHFHDYQSYMAELGVEIWVLDPRDTPWLRFDQNFDLTSACKLSEQGCFISHLRNSFRKKTNQKKIYCLCIFPPRGGCVRLRRHTTPSQSSFHLLPWITCIYYNSLLLKGSRSPRMLSV